MRLSVVLSILLHGALLAVAASLPAIERAHASRPIEVEVRDRPQVIVPPPAPAPTPPPELPKVAMRTVPTREQQEREREREHQHPQEPQTPPAPNAPTPPETHPAPSESAPHGPIDLRLHALPGASGDGIVLPSGEGPSGGMIVGTPPPRKQWHMRGDAGDPILGKIKDEPVDEFPLERVGRDEYVYKGKQFSAHIAPDGSVSFDDKNIRDFNGTSGTFDLNDLIMKGRKEDPYRAEKQRFMKATSKQREELAARARAERMQESLGGLPDHLEAVWALARPAAARRKLLYELWHETATGDDAIGQAGAQARHMIEAFIRRRLPQGSEDAFTDEELAAYSRGKLPFDPYK